MKSMPAHRPSIRFRFRSCSPAGALPGAIRMWVASAGGHGGVSRGGCGGRRDDAGVIPGDDSSSSGMPTTDRARSARVAPMQNRVRSLNVKRRMLIGLAAAAVAAGAAPAAQASTVTAEGDKIAVRGAGTESNYFLLSITEFWGDPGVKWLQISDEAAITSF